MNFKAVGKEKCVLGTGKAIDVGMRNDSSCFVLALLLLAGQNSNFIMNGHFISSNNGNTDLELRRSVDRKTRCVGVAMMLVWNTSGCGYRCLVSHLKFSCSSMTNDCKS